ncbi:MAG TPA: aminotransferase class I/II-fold pyridoxal phosphate-dependent enzyme [Deltaproteobacteria bacterium]|nr:aminotransferase class I/II-fold pyridoxal phosphate-dependent enzyme [Deltaproteobacteria bacterium]
MSDNNTIQFASRMEQLPPYLFGMINGIKMKKRMRGEDVIDLGMGNPTDPTPKRVVEKICDVVRDPRNHRYPVAHGLKNLRAEIARFYSREYEVALDSESEVICTIGSKEGISHLCLAIVGPGDTVIVPTPAFPIHIYASIIAGGSVIRIPLDSEEAFLASIAGLYSTLVPRPKVVMLNYPHNPTGTVTSKEFFKEMIALAKQFGFIIVHDFAYGKITFDGYVAPSFMEIPGAIDVGVEFGSFSKSYNMAGWRIGYCVGNSILIQGLAKIKGYYDYGVFSPVQISGIVALRECDADVTRQAEIYEHRRDVLCRGLSRMGWTINTPKAGMFVWAKIPAPYDRMGSMNFALRMAERANVTMAPGIGFGDEGEGYLRIALVENEHRIRQALKQIKEALSMLDEEANPSLHAVAYGQ